MVRKPARIAYPDYQDPIIRSENGKGKRRALRAGKSAKEAAVATEAELKSEKMKIVETTFRKCP